MPRKPRQKKRRGPEDRQAFLMALAAGQSVTAAAEAAGIDRKTAYRWRDAEPDFAAGWEDALEDGTDRLEDEALRRAFAGSDLLLIFLLKARRPRKYCDRHRVEHEAKAAANTEPTFDFSILTDEELNQLRAMLERLEALEGNTRQPGEGGLLQRLTVSTG